MFTATIVLARVTRKTYSVSRQTGTPLLKLTLSGIGSDTSRRSEPIEAELWGLVAQKLNPRIEEESLVFVVGSTRLLFTKDGDAFLGLKALSCYPVPLEQMLNLGVG